MCNLKHYFRGIIIEKQYGYVHIKTFPSGVYIPEQNIDELIETLIEIKKEKQNDFSDRIQSR